VTWAQWVAGAGVDAIQIREKDVASRRLLEIALAVASRVPREVAIVINGRLDVAIASGAAGVHLPSRGLPLDRVRRRYPNLLIGLSTHRLDEVAAARDAGADYVVFGPVFAPISKASVDAPVGLGALTEAASLGIPVLALGGVTRERLGTLAAAGAAGVAAIGAFQAGQDARSFVDSAHDVFRRRDAARGPERPVGTTP
jgi:thiamine-phosphate pyrophosphorylase